MKKDFTPRKKILILLNYWWVIVLLTIAGGFFAYFVSKFRQPIYEAKATLSAAINYTQTGQMSEADQDRAFQAVSSVLVSDPVRDKVIQEANTNNIQIDKLDFSDLFYLERNNANFDLRVESFSPEEAAILANMWAETGKAVFDFLILQANTLTRTEAVLLAIESCYSTLSGFDSQQINCQLLNGFNPVLETGPLEISGEENGNAGILPAFSLTLTKSAEIGTSPRLHDRNYLIAAGAFLGFMIGILFVETGLMMKWIRPYAKSKTDI